VVVVAAAHWMGLCWLVLGVSDGTLMLAAGFVYNSEAPLGARTTTVPATLSCQDWLSLSIAIHRNSKPTTASDRKQLSARTIAVGQSEGRAIEPHDLQARR